MKRLFLRYVMFALFLVQINILYAQEINDNEITFAWKDELPQSVVEGDNIVAEIVRTGGGEYTWEYTWLNNGVVMSGDEQCTFIAPNGTVSGRNAYLTFNAVSPDFPIETTFDSWTSTNKTDGTTSSNTYTIEVTHSGVLTFDWEVSSESTYDWLVITLDGTEIIKKSGTDSGTYTKEFTSAGTHTLVVRYTKDNSISSGSDQGRIYNIKFIGAALNTTFNSWTSTNKTDGSTSSNTYTIEVTQGNVLTFDWDVSSESNYDWLVITLDGTEIIKKSGTDSGTYTKEFTSAGTHTLVVRYTKDGSQSRGSDQGRIYNIKLTGEPFTHTMTHEYVIYSQPTGQKTSLDDIVLLHDQEYIFSISTQGGLPSGWTYKWFLDGVEIDGATTNAYTANVKNNSSEVKHFVYKVIAKNITNNITRELEYEFNAEVWPAASEVHSEQQHDLYYGDNVLLGVDVAGGYDNGWRYEWIINGNIVSSDATYNYYAAPQNINSKSQNIYVNVFNEHEKSPLSSLFSARIEFNVTSWSHGEIEIVSNVDNYRSGDAIPISVRTNGGYPNWTYEWYYNDELVHTSSEASYTFTAENNYSDSSVRDCVTVVATNLIPKSGASKSDQEYKYFTIWPVVEFPDEVVVGTLEYNGAYFIREGNDLPFNVDYATGGYNAYSDSYWTYKWTEDGVLVKNSSSSDKNYYTAENISGSNSYTKNIKDKTYGLTIENHSPYSSIWYSKSYEIPVKIYSKPSLPSSLVIKGNGNSNTLVCMMSNIDDSTLESREYSFVFGYTDASGEEHFMEPTTERWYQFDSKISVKNSSYKFWVCARWDYLNGTYVTSGRRYLNGSADYQFDASCFNNISVTTRGALGDETTDIENVVYDEVEFNGTNLIANANSLVDGIIEIFSINGKCLDSIDLGCKQHFNEKIDMSKYESGIYIIKIKIGETLINKKVLVP